MVALAKSKIVDQSPEKVLIPQARGKLGAVQTLLKPETNTRATG